MEMWKISSNSLIGLILIQLCSGFPIGLENSAADYHTQFLTGLVGILLTVCGIVFLAGCLCCHRNNGFKEFHNTPVVASTSSLDHGHINPIANGEFTIFTPLSPLHNNNVFFANERIVGQTEIDYSHADFDVRSWFDGSENDFPRTKLKYIKELGKGWFGRVVEGAAQGINCKDDQTWVPVAVRILEASATSNERVVFLHDATIYRCGTHPHILHLLGRSLESVPLLLLQEFCPRGDLKKYLRDNQRTPDKLLSSDLPLLWCCQLSSALKHLHDHKLTHPDLAARNCQLGADLILKLGDYGLAASLYPEDYYQGAPAVPVRWCAPESLTYTSTTIQPKQITFEGNVWSLGVTMWEIYECGTQPYPHLTDDEVISQVLGAANIRLACPTVSVFYTDYIFRLMQMCWCTSESRPSVSQIYLMLSDLMQVYQNTKHIAHTEPPVSIQDFDNRWESFKPNSVVKTDNHEFKDENKSVDLSDVSVLNFSKDDDLLNTKPMSPSLNNLHGSLDNLGSGEMDSWLQKVATKTGDMSYVRGLSEAIKDLDNALALENVSSSDSSHQPSPAPENLTKIKSKLEFKLGPTTAETSNTNISNLIIQSNSLTESVQRTSSESETEDENWRKKVERGVYSEKVQQKSKSVTDLMVLTHIDCSESDSDTPLPSLDYRVNYRNVRYAPKQNLENVSLMFGSEGNLLSVHDKFQEELRRLQDERKDSLLFVPESISHNKNKPNPEDINNLCNVKTSTDSSSSDEETYTIKEDKETACTYVNTNTSRTEEVKNISPVHRNPESLIEELSSPTDIQPGNQVYNIFNVTVNSNFSPIHVKPALKDIICYKDPEAEQNVCQNSDIEVVLENHNESHVEIYQVPKLADIIQNNDDLMDYIINKYETPEDAVLDEKDKIEESVTPDAKIATQDFLKEEQAQYDSSPLLHVQFDISSAQEAILPNSMIHSGACTSTPFIKKNAKDKSSTSLNEPFDNQEGFSSQFVDVAGDASRSELTYSLETWDNFLGSAFDSPREHITFNEFSTEPQSLLFTDDHSILNVGTVNCKNDALIHDFNEESEIDLNFNKNVSNMDDTSEDMKETSSEETAILNNTCVISKSVEDCKESDLENVSPSSETCNKDQIEDELNLTFTVTQDSDQSCENIDTQNAKHELDEIYTKDDDKSSGSNNWEPGDGWFLHPQVDADLSGEMETSQSGDTESYVGFGMDDEIVAAIRNELLLKLPQAQGQSSEQIKESDDWDTEERSEVLIRYTTPLSPIPEESCSEQDSHHLINREDSSISENEDWPEPYEEHNSGILETETQSIQNIESPIQEPHHRHTPSQDSCCSNDTLFNLEELTYAINENDGMKDCKDIDKRICDPCDKEIEQIIGKNANKEYAFKIEKPSMIQTENDADATDISTNSKNILKDSNFNCINMVISNLDDEVFLENNISKTRQTLKINVDNLINQDSDIDYSSRYSDYQTIKTGFENIFAEILSNAIIKEHLTEHKSKIRMQDALETVNNVQFQNDTILVTNFDNESNLMVIDDTESIPNNTNGNAVLRMNEKSKENQNIILDANDADIEETHFEKNNITDDSENLLNTRNDININESCLIHNNTDCDNSESKKLLESQNKKSIPQNQTKIILEKNHANFVNYENIKEPQDSTYNSDISKLNIKNIQNQIQSSKDSLSEYEANFINCVDDKLKCDIPNMFHTTKETIDADEDLNSVRASDPTNFGLLVENNPNYITEFLNHERQSSISSLGSSRDDDEFTQNLANDTQSQSDTYYANVDAIKIQLTEGTSKTPDYVNTNDLLNLTQSDVIDEKLQPDYVNVQYDNLEEHLYDPVANDNIDGEIYDALSDIRFTGPADNQLMSTSFSESADIDDQDWDSGSDTRSSSSGEFIWKEGEHEESVKALRAAPQDVTAMDKITAMEDIEEVSSESSDEEDEEGDSPEFVPSAWDKYATPTKSALRSPEKTLEKTEIRPKKSKGVWFKKQKYHCVYEYPREPESPSINSYDLWQPSSSVIDWEMSTNSYIPSVDGSETQPNYFQNTKGLYHLPNFTGISTLDDEFFISSTTKPFETFGGLSSQFFPGQNMPDEWMDLTKQPNANITPDSGAEDITPASTTDNGELIQKPPPQIQTLKLLAAAAVKSTQINELKSNKGSLGGLRHARNKLKLDLPPSPSAFTSTKVFTIEPPEEPITQPEVPTFTTFGKSRFLVQHVETPTCDEENQNKNVSFEALPYKPIHIEKGKIEIVRGEASLLDSADEDSGIESSTLERKNMENLSNVQ